MDHTIELNPPTCICFVCVTGKLNVSSIQHNRRLLSSRKYRNNINGSVVVEEFEERNEGRKQHRPSKTQTAPARPFKASFNASCDDNNEFGDEMLADGKVRFYRTARNYWTICRWVGMGRPSPEFLLRRQFFEKLICDLTTQLNC